MTHKTRQLAIAAALACGLAAATTSRAEAPSNAHTTEQRPVEAFQAIELSGPYRVIVKAQGKPALTLSGERSRLSEIETRVSGGTLHVRPVARHSGPYFNFGRKRDEVTITITASALHSLKMSGSGDVELDQLSTDKFTLQAEGSGDLRGSGSVRDLAVSARGSGDMDLRQLKASNINLSMAGSGDMELAGPATRADAEMRGSGDLRIERLQAQSVRVVQQGSGDVTLDGETASLSAEVGGSGGVEATTLKVGKATVRSRSSGDIELGTVSDTLDAELHGSGSLAAAMAGKRLVLNISGSGDADIKGTVDKVDARLSGSGSLEAPDLLAGKADVAVRGSGTAVVNVRSTSEAKTAMLGKPRLLTIDRRGSHQSD